MLQRVERALEHSTELSDSLRLREINYIIFPDCSVSEEILAQELARVIQSIASHPERSKITLLIYTNGIAEEDANLLLSGIAMNLLLEDDLNIEDLEISLIEKLEMSQWQALLPRLQARIILEHENQEAISTHPIETIPLDQVDNLLRTQ